MNELGPTNNADEKSEIKKEKEPDHSLLEDLCMLETNAEFEKEYGDFGLKTIRKAKEVLSFARPVLVYALKSDADIDKVRKMAAVIVKMMGHGAWTDDFSV